jgi:hypothetical protein
LITPFKNVLSNKPNIVLITKREIGTWGDIGIVKGTINCMREINTTNKGYTILLSAQDYPIKSLNSINNYLSKENGHDFIEISPIKEVFPEEWSKRINQYKYNLSNQRGKYIFFPLLYSKHFFSKETLKSIVKIIIYRKRPKFILTILSNLLRKRKYAINIVPYAGGQWWALTNKTVFKILNFIDENSSYLDYHRYTYLPDEIFFQCILMHLKKVDTEIKTKDAITYVNWFRKNCSLPVTFSHEDIEELSSQPEHKLFARKFDFEYDVEIIQKLDKFNEL